MTTLIDDNPYLTVRKAFDAPWPGPRGAAVELRNGALAATIHPDDGCRITSLTAFGFELLRPWTPQRRAFQYGSFPLVPWVGRLRGGVLRFGGQAFQLPVNKPPHALHGMACYGPWRIVEAGATAATLRVDLDDPWPWRARATQRYELQGDALVSTLTVESAGAAFPAAGGWHPWFRKWIGRTGQDAAAVGPDAERLIVAFDADWQEEPGPDELPTGRRIAPRPGPWDDCFGFIGPLRVLLTWPGKLRLEMTSPASALVVFDKQPDATCVNPLSGPPDGVNTAPRLVTPADPLVVTTRWAVSR